MENKVKDLESKIKYYAEKYYSGESLVSDEYFDQLVQELKELSPSSVVLNTGWGFSPKRSKAHHKYNLLIGSLPKIKSLSSIPSTFDLSKCRISVKLDGLSVVSYYQEGKRYQSITRGNGTVGQDVTDKINMISPQSNLVTNPDGSLFSGALRGEVCISNNDWSKYYKDKYKDDPSKNPRNVASGLLNKNNLSQDEANTLSYVVYKIVYSEDYDYSSFIGVNTFIKDLIYNSQDLLVPYVTVHDSSVITEQYFKNIYDKFSTQYPCDGLVISKLVGNCLYEEVAYKFPAESKEVEVIDVKYSATRTGRLVPVIEFTPVVLSGAVVSRCTGFNAKFILNNKIGKGSIIEVCRSNEVIPTILRVIKSSENSLLPEECPNCHNSDLIWVGEDLVCTNENESQLPYYFITTVAPEEGAGSSLYTKIIDTFQLEDVQSLCDFLNKLKNPDEKEYVKEEISSAITGKVTRVKVHNIIDKLSSDIEPVEFLSACNIKGVSYKISESILNKYPDFIINIKEYLSNDKLYEVEGVGSKTVSIISNFSGRIISLSKAVRLSEHTSKSKQSNQFSVAITGSLSVKRSDFVSELSCHNIQVSNNFKMIKYLICNNTQSTSSKMTKAINNGVEVISEDEFRSKYLINSNN